jgi:esterase
MKNVNGAHTAKPRCIALCRLAGYLFHMDLSYRESGGDGPPIVILHGLFGSAQNWSGMGRRLVSRGRVYALDLRNHGDSPHAPTHSLSDCVEDLHDWATAHTREPLRLIGHSLGGQIAMGFALAHPELASGIAVVDIAPRAYPEEHESEYRALLTDISGCRSRAEVDALLSPLLPDLRDRQFILTNAVRAGEGFRWRLNVEALRGNTVSSDIARMSGEYRGETLLVACGRSEYVVKEDHAVMKNLFPRVRIETIQKADHWPHISAPEELEKLLVEFLERARVESTGAVQ